MKISVVEPIKAGTSKLSAEVPSKVFFVGLNELRAIAALGVLVHHIELYKFTDNHNSLYNTKLVYLVEHLGKNSVFLFFVLSGFLITYLLLKEIEKTKTVDIKSFYIRRILKIWPLYYLIVFISFCIIPLVSQLSIFNSESYYSELIAEISYGWNLVLFLLFLSNFALKFFTPVVGAAQSWSVSVEEQFYSFWPWLLKYFHKRIFYILILIIVTKPLALVCLRYLNYNFINSEALGTLITVFDLIKIELMAVGGLGAWFLYKYPDKSKQIFCSKKTLFLALILSLTLMNVESSSILLGFSFLGLILCIVYSKMYVPVLDSIGKISYGVYMYHPIAMYVVFALVHSFYGNEEDKNNIFIYNGLVYVSTVALTIVMSWLSYTYFENRFLKYKDRYQNIKSGKL